MQKLNKYNFYLINIIFMMFPISIILGNFATNLNFVILLLLTSIFFLIKKKKINLEISSLDKSIITFFFLSLVIILYNFFENLYFNNEQKSTVILKTILFQRYLIIYFLIKILLKEKILKINWFNLIAAFCAFFVCLDIFFQFLFGKDFFGIYPVSDRHFSALFGEELIAGGYLYKFGLFIFFFLDSLKLKSNFKSKTLLLIFFLSITTGIILSGNRIPLFLFFISFLSYFYFFKKNYNKFLIKLFLIFIFIFIFFYQTNNNIKNHFNNFYNNGISIIELTFLKDISKESDEVFKIPYVSEFYCSKKLIQEKPFIGEGIRSYRTRLDPCRTHPHNYYLEIFVDLGFFGLISILLIIIFLIRQIILYKKNNIYIPVNTIPFLLILISEFFPLRTSGSFFSTNNAIIIFISLSITSYITQNKQK